MSVDTKPRPQLRLPPLPRVAPYRSEGVPAKWFRDGDPRSGTPVACLALYFEVGLRVSEVMWGKTG